MPFLKKRAFYLKTLSLHRLENFVFSSLPYNVEPPPKVTVFFMPETLGKNQKILESVNQTVN